MTCLKGHQQLMEELEPEPKSSDSQTQILSRTRVNVLSLIQANSRGTTGHLLTLTAHEWVGGLEKFVLLYGRMALDSLHQ